MTDVNSWLLDPNANPVVLIDCHHTEGVRRIGTQPYITGPDADPANAVYDDFVTDGLVFAAQMGANRSIGQLEFWGMEDEHLLKWTTYAAWIGDMSWPFAQFEPLAAGVIERATRPARRKIRLEFSDPSKPLQSQLLTQKTGDVLTPLALGTVFNASPIVENDATLKYRASSEPCQITAVRDNGLPVAGYTDHGDGSFTLAINQEGDITCDVIGQNNTVESACNFIAQQSGLFVSDVINFGDFQNTAKIGLYVTGNETAWDLINQLCSSIGVFPRFNEFGELELVHMPHSGAAEFEIYDDDIWQDGFSQSSVEPARNVQLNYRKNWNAQSNLAGAVTPDNRELYGRNSSQIDIDNGAADQELQLVETLLAEQTDAQTEAIRRGQLWATEREIWRFDAVLPGLAAKLGQRVYVDIADAITGTGTIIGWSKRPDRKACELEVMF